MTDQFLIKSFEVQKGKEGVLRAIPVIIDTDVDFDDYLAVLYLLKHPEVEVIGITVTGVGANNYSPLPSPISRISMVLLFSDGPLAKRRI